MLSSFQKFYLKNVLGIKHFFRFEQLKSQTKNKKEQNLRPSVLVVLSATPQSLEEQLLKKIMKAISVFQFDICHMRSEKFRNEASLYKKVFIFCKTKNLDFSHLKNKILLNYDLSDFFGVKAQERKKALWLQLKSLS